MRSTRKVHLPSLGMLLLSGGGALLASTAAAGFFLGGVIFWVVNDSSGSAQVFFSFGWIAALQFFLLLPAGILAGMRLLDVKTPDWQFKHAYLLSLIGLLFVPPAIGLGYILTRNIRLAELFLPVIQLAIVGFPLVWLIQYGTRGFEQSSHRQGWGIFTFSTLVSIPFILIVELIVLFAIGVLAVVWLRIWSPEIFEGLTNTLQRLANSDMDPEAVLRILRPYLKQSGVMIGGLAITSGIVPLLEEFLKPMALWFFAPRRLTPREGFIGGMICGASFALLESLGALASPAMEAWPILAIGRIGTGILHTTTSGLVGWGLASAWREGKYGILAAAFTAAVFFHAVWNIFGLFIGLEEFSHLLGIQSELFLELIKISPLVLLLLSGLLISVLRRANLLLKNPAD